MQIKGNIIEFKSTDYMYKFEQKGDKSNTVRWLDIFEYEELFNAELDYIRIYNIGTKESFMRKISFLMVIQESINMKMILFCWRNDQMNYIEMSKECESCRVHNDEPDCKNCKRLKECWKEVNND